MAPDRAGDPLDGDVRDAEKDSGRRAEHVPVMLGRRPELFAHDEQRPGACQSGLERDHPGDREPGVRTVDRGQGQPQ